MPDEEMDTFDSLDDDEESSEGAGGPGGGLKSFFSGTVVRILLFVAAGLVVVIIAIVAGSMAGKSSSTKSGYAKDKEALKTKKKPLKVFDLKQFMANTADIDASHLVRIKLKLAYEAGDIKLMTELNARRAQIRDIIMLFFNDKKKRNLDTALKKRKLKGELMKTINRILIDGEIKNIFYEEFSVN